MPWDSSDRRKSLPKNWRTIRAAVLDRDLWVCQLRDDGCTVLAEEVDHVGDRADHSLGNLRAVCSWCHKRRTAAQGNAARARKYGQNKRPPETHPGLS